jgi:glyoxylase-like metal-dependent hydrolase (beta-lactamase superfamily II)
MQHAISVLVAAVLTAASAAAWPQEPAAPAPKPPVSTTIKVAGTDNVYAFTNAGRVSMFVVTTAGVIATDPGGYGRPQRVQTYLEEIRKITDKPIKYLVYSHHHYDHIAGGQPFKDAGAKIVAHKNAKLRLARVKDPNTPLPDETFDKKKLIKLGGTTLELTYHGLNHSDSTIVMRLPKEKVIFVVDILPVGSVPGRGMIDFYPLEAEKSIESMLKLDWNTLIPGHPGDPGGRFGTRADAEAQLQFLRDASEAMKGPAREGKCWEPAEREVKLPNYESWAGYQNNLPFVMRRYCGLWGRGT